MKKKFHGKITVQNGYYKKKQKAGKNMKMLALISQLAIAMLTSLLICGGIGYAIDAHFGTGTFVFFLILGVLGGYKACYNIICQFLGKKSLFEPDPKRTGMQMPKETKPDETDDEEK